MATVSDTDATMATVSDTDATMATVSDTDIDMYAEDYDAISEIIVDTDTGIDAVSVFGSSAATYSLRRQ